MCKMLAFLLMIVSCRPTALDITQKYLPQLDILLGLAEENVQSKVPVSAALSMGRKKGGNFIGNYQTEENLYQGIFHLESLIFDGNKLR